MPRLSQTSLPAWQPIPPFEIAALAASAGGFAAFSEILSGLPADFPAPVLLLQHLSIRYRSLLPELLARVTSLEVVQAQDRDELLPGRVYVAPPGLHLLVRPDRTLALSDSEPVWFTRPAADRLFKSLPASFGSRAVGVILTGRGCDGAQGIQAIHRAGGTTIAQSPKSCTAAGMPSAAIETGCVDMVLSLQRIGPMLQVLFSRNKESAATPIPV
jgi:two-component system, chemotaxis family, protein-glutamate methylesterase/glutaminase